MTLFVSTNNQQPTTNHQTQSMLTAAPASGDDWRGREKIPSLPKYPSHAHYKLTKHHARHQGATVSSFYLILFSFLAAPQHMECPGQESGPSRSCDLPRSCGSCWTLHRVVLCPGAAEMLLIPLCCSGNSSHSSFWCSVWLQCPSYPWFCFPWFLVTSVSCNLKILGGKLRK